MDKLHTTVKQIMLKLNIAL